MTIVDLFAGPGGWEEGLRLLGVDDVVGLEWDDAACDTAEAAGHVRHRVDVAEADPADYRGAEGVIASPPCQAFSMAGKGAGREAIGRLLDHVASCRDGWVDPPGELCSEDVRADLTLQPLRWVDELRPSWVACEQVPGVLPLWRAMAWVLGQWGYSTWAGVLRAEQYGVPQTRQRAFLLASRVVPASPPEPTHTRYDPRLEDGGKHDPGGLFGTLEPWVSMAEALGWGEGLSPAPTVTADGTAAGGVEVFASRASRDRVAREVAYVNGNQSNAAVRPADAPAPTVHFGAAMNDVRWTVRTGQNSMKRSRDPDDMEPYERSVHDPAPTVRAHGTWTVAPEGGHPDSPMRWKMAGAGQTAQESAGQQPRDAEEPAHTITGAGSAAWVHDRPATTVVSQFRPDIIAAPGWRSHGDESRQNAPGSVRVTVQEAAVLQSFRPDYPWSGSKTKRYEQVGNAIPPLLAKAVLAPLLDAREVAA